MGTTETPQSLTSRTASSLNSRLNTRCCMETSDRIGKPYLGVHQTGRSSSCSRSTPMICSSVNLNTSSVRPLLGRTLLKTGRSSGAHVQVLAWYLDSGKSLAS